MFSKPSPLEDKNHIFVPLCNILCIFTNNIWKFLFISFETSYSHQYLCLCPPDTVTPRSPNTVLYPSGNFVTKSWAFAFFAASYTLRRRFTINALRYFCWCIRYNKRLVFYIYTDWSYSIEEKWSLEING